MPTEIEIVAVEIDGEITTDRRRIYGKIEFGNKMPKLIRREIFELMEACDLWREHGISKLPAMYKLTPEQWEKANKLGIIK